MPDPRTLLVAWLVLVAGAAGWACLACVRGAAPRPGPRRPGPASRAVRALTGPLFAVRAVAAAVAAVVVFVGSRWPVAAAAVGLLVLCWPVLFGATKASKDRIAQLDALVQWTEGLRDVVSGAVGLAEAVPASVDTAPLVLRPALLRLRGLLEARESMTTALEEFRRDLADPSADQVVRALLMQERSRGPALAQALRGLAEASREELDLRRRIVAERRGDRRNVQIVVVLTGAMATALALFFPPALRAPYDTLTGQLVLAGVCGVFAGGFLWLRRLAGADVAEQLDDTDVPDVWAGARP